MPNRLEGATSLYLRQHAANPIDWYPWGDAAFERARTLDRPVFLSVGYAACHWCHVMAHESFEDGGVARALNEGFVAVKVDREERPDVDEAYMAAVQLASGRGGWPMSLFLTPERKPFLAATYLPRDDRGGRPGFLELCRRVAEAWSTERDALLGAAEELADAIERVRAREAPPGPLRPDASMLDEAVQALAGDYDLEHGGFGAAPKFPPHTSIELLLAYAEREDRPKELREAARGMAHGTLEQMCLGGLHDHVGGGFHRYSVDERWLLPHFEKMLVDNALMLGNLARAERTGFGSGTLYARVGERLFEWLEREMRLPDGLYASGIDADSEGEEGRYYVWTCAEVEEVLGVGAAAFLEAYRFEQSGNFADEATGLRSGANIPHGDPNTDGRFDEALRRLAGRRKDRPAPALDDKAVVGWNGLAISALVLAGRLDPAERVASALMAAEERRGDLPRLVRGDQTEGLAFVEDFAYLADGLFCLAEATGSERWRSEAARLGETMIERFYDEDAGGFLQSSDRHERLFGPSKPVFDQPAPSANGVALRCLSSMGEGGRAYQTLAACAGWMAAAPQATEALLVAAMPLLAGAGSAASQATGPALMNVEVRLEPERWIADASGVALGQVVMEIPPGVHVNDQDPPARWLTPTEVGIEGIEAQVDAPAAMDHAYVGTVRFDVHARLPEGSSEAEFEATVRFQPCTDSECLEPQERRLTGLVRRA